MAAASGYNNSAVASATYTLVAATPSFSPAPGNYASPLSVSILDATPNSTIYYTTDNSNPTTSSAVYTAAIPVNAATTIKAMATAAGFGNSSVATGAYTIGAVDFSLSDFPASLTIARSSSGNSTVTVSAVNGFSSAVSFTLQGLPSKTNYSFTPSSVTGSGSSTLKISVNRPASPGTYPLTITGTGGGLTHTVGLTLTIQ
jgi:kumamolisin